VIQVLVIDDEHGTNTLAAEYLRLAGLQVVARFDGETGWSALLTESYAVAIIDRRLPDIDGTALCARIKSDPRTAHVKVLLISAVGGPGAKGAASGPDAFLAKPFRPKDLAAEVRRLLGEAAP
jgi:DNA-binding response OmpR family regulator